MTDEERRLRRLLEMISSVGVRVHAVGAEAIVPDLKQVPPGWSWVHLLGADGQVVPWLHDALSEVTSICKRDPAIIRSMPVRHLLTRPEPLLLLCASGGWSAPLQEPFARAVWREVQSARIRA